jgi:hypothetical protein
MSSETPVQEKEPVEQPIDKKEPSTHPIFSFLCYCSASPKKKLNTYEDLLQTTQLLRTVALKEAETHKKSQKQFEFVLTFLLMAQIFTRHDKRLEAVHISAGGLQGLLLTRPLFILGVSHAFNCDWAHRCVPLSPIFLIAQIHVTR